MSHIFYPTPSNGPIDCTDITPFQEPLKKRHYNFQKDCLEVHNKLRREHGCPELNWSVELSEHAQIWAEKVAERGYVNYADLGGVGEIIHLIPMDSPDKPPNGKEVAEMWAKERKKYNFDKPGWQAGSNKFTQMVWKSSTEFGVGRAICPRRRSLVVVALYRPGGNTNWPGEFQSNVPTILSKHSLE